MKNALYFCLLLPIFSECQTPGRFEEAKRLGFAYVASEQFDRAAAKLEEIWETDQSDPAVGEHLAMAYFNSTEKQKDSPMMEKEAIAITEKLFAAGHRVSFMVQHSHEKMTWLQGREMNQYCRGRLSVAPGRITYIADKGEKAPSHSFDVTSIREISLNEDDRRGTFVLKTAAGSFFFAIRNRNRNEARLLADLVRRSQKTR